ncbi:MAG: F0F1 ATP synthase subunit epsilon, partial [Rhizobiaceae bacterium]
DLVSPERLLLSAEAEMVTLPGTEGYFGVLAGHAPVISTLKPGVIDVKGGPEGGRRFFVSAGFAEVTAEKLTVLAEEAIPMESVDAAVLDRRIANAEEDILQAKTGEARAKAVIALDSLKQLRAAL